MTFERLRCTAITELIALEQQYKASIGELPLDQEQIQRLQHAVKRDVIEFYVAVSDAKLVGMCSISPLFSTFCCEQSAVMEDFFIAEPFRHRGVARGLTAYVFEQMRRRGITSVWVGAADVDIGMYRSLGFATPLGTLLTWNADVGGAASACPTGQPVP